MKIELKEFQEKAVDVLTRKVRDYQRVATSSEPKTIILSAPTGAGKTIIATTMIERIISGDDYCEPNHDAVFLWITDIPELNNQTYNKMIKTSDILNPLNLEIIDSSSFNQKDLTPGRMYFLNTQKLGKDRLLTSLGDGRQYTIWETIDNTIKERGSQLIVIIDEAHRGMRKPKEEEQTMTIIQRFLKGYKAMLQAPLVVGISATPDRFLKLVGTSRGLEHVAVKVADVQNSGLIKKNIVLFHSEDDRRKDMTLLRVATQHWLNYTKYWTEYCKKENEKSVTPIFVVQVENAPKGKRGTLTDLDQVIIAINGEVPNQLSANAFAHSFDESVPYDTGNRIIRYIAPSQITEDRDVKVVFFKTALSTGWDCPRAETMMSFRKAKDSTYIAQLIGRMVRTPLARTIESDERLNSVALFLPYYNLDTVNSIIAKLRDPEHEFISPIEIQSNLDKVSLKKRSQTEPIFERLEKIPSYEIPLSGNMKQTRRLMKLSQALVQDNIDKSALESSKKKILCLLKKRLLSKRDDSEFNNEVANISKITYSTKTYNFIKQEITNESSSKTKVAPENIDNIFQKAGRNIGEGLHQDFWELMVKDIDDIEKIKKVKVEVSLLLSDPNIIQLVEKRAEQMVDRWLQQYNGQIEQLTEGRKFVYKKIRRISKNSTEKTLSYPDFVDWSKPKDTKALSKHLYVDNRDEFFDKLNELEIELLEIEIKDSIGWLRNLPRKPWSLAIPYKLGSGHKLFFPDFLFFRENEDRIIIDILDPHGHFLDDALMKAKGLATYADEHGHYFGRIEVVNKIDNNIKRLNLKDSTTRERLQDLTTNTQLSNLYKDRGL